MSDDAIHADPPRCARCEHRQCYAGEDCFGTAGDHRDLYRTDAALSRLHEAATAIEARHYGKAPRLQEIIYFAREMGAEKIGLAFCIGLAAEAKIIDEILAEAFDVISVCCKACGIPKKDYGLEQLRPEKPNEVMCNPAGQADLMNRAGCDLNVVCGLCVGHDAIFSKVSEAPVTTLIAKDRVLAHNPAGALYCRYVRRKIDAGAGAS